MSSEIPLQDIYEHPLVAEIINENRELRQLNSEKPEVKDLKDIPLPYTIKRHLLINEGSHNGTFYSAQILRMALNQHEGLSLFLDHHANDQGGTAESWCGSIRNPTWSEADKGIVADVDIVDPKTAISLAYGAKFGISATVDVEAIEKDDKEIATDPIFKSYSIVLDPAVRETMLNENQSESELEQEEEGEVEEMSEELDLKSDLKPTLAKLDDAIGRASAMKDTSLLVSLQQVKAMLGKLAGTAYPYPKPGSPAKLDELEAKLSALEQVITTMHLPSEPAGELPNKSEELEAALKENEIMKEQLNAIDHDKLVAHADGILKKELELGLVASAETDARRKELETMDVKSLGAIEQNLDKTIKILESDEKDSKPDPNSTDATGEGERKELSASKASSERLLQMMVNVQSEGQMPYGSEK